VGDDDLDLVHGPIIAALTTVTFVQWTASMISPTDDFGGAPILRAIVTLDEGHGAVTNAVWHVSALGVFEAFLDGVPAADDVLSPGWSAYEWRIRYRTYNVTARLRDGVALECRLGNGWYRGRLGWAGGRALYGDRLGLIAQLEVTFADGHVQRVVTDDTWRAHPSSTTDNDLYDGQTIDARRDDHSAPSGGVDVLDFDTNRLVPYVGPPVVRRERIAPQRIWTSPSGKTLVDFGQNLVGWIRLRATGAAGTTITVRHAEVLEHDELCTFPLRTAQATDTFILGGGNDEFEPTLTFHGFRYAEVTGFPGELTADDLEAVVVHSELRRTGYFACSDDALNQLHSNVVWGLRGNFLDVPTDCPQRDERLGWTGDLAVFAPTAAYLYDVDGFLRDWLLDLAAEQKAQGRVPVVIPDVLKFDAERANGLGAIIDTTAIWADASVWVPWALWQAYGDVSVLDTQYDSMAAHMRRVESMLSPNRLWDTGFQFGDWLDPDAPVDQPWRAKAKPQVVATACVYRSARMVAEAARLTGRDADAADFDALAEATRAAFNEHFVEADGRILSDAATAYALAIVFGLLDDDVATKAGDRLAELVEERGFRISTGFAGTPYMTDALTMTGHLDHAYRLLLERECPSWLYSVSQGATTIWERWDSMLPDGSINDGGMTSFNHYALGAVADWMHRTIGGITPLAPGYTKVLVDPKPGGGITWAKASLDTRHGTISVDWRLEGDELIVDVDAPAGVEVVRG
jgi:alpha-L-rhamnosidase